MSTEESTFRYRSYLLRYQSNHDTGDHEGGQFCLEDAATGQRIAFADLPALVAFLDRELNEVEEGADHTAPAVPQERERQR